MNAENLKLILTVETHMLKRSIMRFFSDFTNLTSIFAIAAAIGLLIAVSPAQAAAPSVISTSPANGAVNIPVNTQITATFDVSMDQMTISDNFTVVDDLGITLPSMGIGYNDLTKTASYSAIYGLSYNRTYTATLSTGVKDALGNALSAPYSWTFSAATINDPIPPTIISAVPSNGLTNIPTSLSSISFTFDKDIIPSSLTASGVTISDPLNNHPSTMGMQVLGRTITYWIVSQLSTSTVYTVNVSNIQSLAGVTMDPFTWSFTTSDIATTAPTDSTPPQVLSVTPVNLGRTIATNTSVIKATFTTIRPLLASSVNASNFTVKDNFNVPLIPSSVEYINSAAIFTPSTPLLPDRTYTATINGFQTAVGAIMTTPYIWSFSTVNAIPPTVASTTPANGATGLSTAFMAGRLTVIFDQYMDYYDYFDHRKYTITDDLGYSITPNSMYVSGKTVGLSNFTLNPNRTYTVTVAAIKNASGVPMIAPYSFSFSSEVIADPGAPMVTMTDPLNATNKTTAVTRISATFDKDLLAGSVATSTFAISDDLGAIYFPSSASYSAKVATAFLPALPANRTYTVSVSGVRNIVGTLMAAPHTWSFSTAAALTAPTDLSATTSQTTADVSWTASSGGTAPIVYAIQRDGVVVATTTATSYSDTGLTPYTPYVFSLLATDSNTPTSQTATSVLLNVMTLPAPIINISNLTATPQQTTVSLNWTPATGGTLPIIYNIYRDGSAIGSTNSTSFSDFGLISSTTYSYSIVTTDASIPQQSTTSNSVITTTLPSILPALTSPSNLAGSSTLTSINLSWTPSSGGAQPISYLIFRNSAFIGSTVNPNFTDTGLSASTTYSYFIQAIDSKVPAQSTTSASALIATAQILTPPSNIILSPASDSMGIAWNGSIGGFAPINYNIYRDGINVGNTASTSFTDLLLSPLTSYNYMIVANDSGNLINPIQTASSTIINAVTLDFPPLAIPMTLNAGWNLVSLPAQPVDLNSNPINYTAESFGQLAGADTVTSWNSATQQYSGHIVGIAPVNNFSLQEGIGYFVHVATGTTINFLTKPFLTSTSTPTASIGWNLFGWNNAATTTAQDFGLLFGADTVSRFNSLTQQFSGHMQSIPFVNNFIINQGDAIFVHKL